MGANAPDLQRKIMSNLEQEKKVLKEGGQRIEVIIKTFFHFYLLLFVYLASYATCCRGRR
jgi:hypothetical protein